MSMSLVDVARRSLALSLVALGSTLLAGAAAPSEVLSMPATPALGSSSEPTPTDANRCFPACVGCEGRCPASGRERDNCRDACHDANATCCEANGKQGNYKMCACH